MNVALQTQHPRLSRLRTAQLVTRQGRLTKVMPTYLEAVGPDVSIGTVCEMPEVGGSLLAAEVVGLDKNIVKLMPYGPTSGLRVGERIIARRTAPSVGVGEAFFGRVIDGLGNAIDGGGAINHTTRRQLNTPGIRLGQRDVTARILETGIKVIDAVLTLGLGQRIGVFAGSGAGKTTLLSGITRSAQADRKERE